MRTRKRNGFGWKRWSKEWLYTELGLYNDYQVRYYHPKAAPVRRVACGKCGAQIVDGYSCKRRGACPSCSARRMCGTAAHLVEHVLPADAPLMQWGS
jgi:hypothetical protein